MDRDGVINVDRGYVHKREDFEFCDGIFELCKFFIRKSFGIFIITNQSGIARQYYTEQDFQNLNNWMLNEFERNGVYISSVYHCPHLPSITGPCDCRKPKAGLLHKAISDFMIDPKASIFIGDHESDITCAMQANIGLKVLLRGSNHHPTKNKTMADCVIKSVRDGLVKLDNLVLD